MDLDVAVPAPRTLALVKDTRAFSAYLVNFLRSQGMQARWFSSGDDWLCNDRPFNFEFYILDLMRPGIDGLSLLRSPRKRSNAGVLVVSGKSAATVFDGAILGGADMHLARPVSFEPILLATKGVYRRSANASGASAAWRLHEARAISGPPPAASRGRCGPSAGWPTAVRRERYAAAGGSRAPAPAATGCRTPQPTR